MATFNLRKFTDPGWLSTISPDRLIRFLCPWSDYLAKRGFDLPPAGSAAVDCEALARVLMSPDASSPPTMIDALYYIHETSSHEDMEELQAKVLASGLHITDDPELTPADYAIEIWLADASLIHERHAESVALQQQNFEYHAGQFGQRRTFPEIDDAANLKIRGAFDDWFSEHKRGRGCRLFIFRHPPCVWLLIRHGLPMRREASHGDDGNAGTEFYRPQQHDVLIYDENTDEMGVHASTKGERKLYLSTFGRLLFGDEDYFPQTPKYTLAPLIEPGAASLNCDDIEGIDSITLVEYRQYWGGKHKESEVRRATDVFAALEKRRSGQIAGVTPSAAIFRVTFSGSPKERRVVIRTPASARYERNEDSEIVEHWLRERGFLLARSPTEGRDD